MREIITRWSVVLLWFLWVLRFSAVFGQVRVEAAVGESVLLPCSVSEVGPSLKTASVYWTDKDDSVVLDIIRNVQDLSKQNEKFKGRVSSFPDRYETGNFSIVIQKVQLTDTSPYECLIPKVDLQQRVVLTVTAERVAVSPPAGPAGGGAPGGGAPGLTCTWTGLLMSLLMSLLSCLM